MPGEQQNLSSFFGNTGFIDRTLNLLYLAHCLIFPGILRHHIVTAEFKC